jgi:hypothetical protein
VKRISFAYPGMVGWCVECAGMSGVGTSLARIFTINTVAAYAMIYWSSGLIDWENSTPHRAKPSRTQPTICATERVPCPCAPIRAAGWKHAAFGDQKRRLSEPQASSDVSPKSEYCTGSPRSGPQTGAHGHGTRSGAKPRSREAARSSREAGSLHKPNHQATQVTINSVAVYAIFHWATA